MSESAGMQGADDLQAGGGVSAGAMLRQLRESAAVSIEALAGALKVPVGKLQALEADQYEAFPDVVFMRALASSMCRALKADAAPVLALLPSGQPAQLTTGRGINTALKSPAAHKYGKTGALDSPKSRTLGVAVAVLLVAALVVALMPKWDLDLGLGVAGGTAQDAAQPAQPAQQPAAEHRAEPAVQQGGEPVAAPGHEPAPAAAASPGAAAEPAAAGGAPTASAQAAATQTTATQAAAEAAPQGVLVIRTRADSWVQVRNAAGGVVLQKVLAAGESFTAAGDPPWSVVIGKADATEVIVRGQPLDLKTIARENVARFEVK